MKFPLLFSPVQICVQMGRNRKGNRRQVKECYKVLRGGNSSYACPETKMAASCLAAIPLIVA
jgi:hypothetical protein